MAIFALYPDIHARVRAEADAVWPGAPSNPTARLSSSYKEDFPRLVSPTPTRLIQPNKNKTKTRS